MSPRGDGFASAQAAYDAAEPPDYREALPARVTVTFTASFEVDVDLDNYRDGDPLLKTAEEFVRQEVEDHLHLAGHYGGDPRLPMNLESVEMSDFEVEVTEGDGDGHR